MTSLEALLKDLNDFQASAQATLDFISSKLSLNKQSTPPLFPCPIDPQHRVPASALADHTASCQAAKGGFDLRELIPPASSFLYADAPGVVQLHRLPVDQPRPPLPPQPKPPPLLPQPNAPPLQPQQPPSPNWSVGTTRDKSFLRVALQQWQEIGAASTTHQLAAKQEICDWRDVPSPLPPEAGRLISSVPPDSLAKLVQLGAAEGGVGLTLEEAGAIGNLLMWQSQPVKGSGASSEQDDRRQRVLTAVALLRPPAGAGPFLLHLWQHVLGGLLRSLPPVVPEPPAVSATGLAAAVEKLRDGVRMRQQREHAMRPGLSRAERLAKYDSGVQTAAAVRAQRPAYRPLPDHDWLFRPHDPNQPQGPGGRRNRVELLAELRDLKRRTTSYRAKKQRTPLQSARDLIELRMLQLEEAFGPARDPVAGSVPSRAGFAAARAPDSRRNGTGELGPGSLWGADTDRKRRNEGGPDDGSRSKRGRWDDDDRGRERRDRGEREERVRRESSRYRERGSESNTDRSARYERGRREGYDERGRDQGSTIGREARRDREGHEEIEEGELPQKGRGDHSREDSSRGHARHSEWGSRTDDGRRSENFGRKRTREKDAKLDGSFESGGSKRGEREGGTGRWGDEKEEHRQRDKGHVGVTRGFGRPGEWWSEND